MTAVLLHDLWLNKHYILVRHIFGIWIEGDCSSEQFDAFFFDLGQKLSDWRNFKKKSQMVENWNISENRGGRKFFWNCVNRSIFLRFWKRRHQIVWKSNPLIEKIIKNIYMYIRGGGSPWTFCLPLKKCWYENWWARPPLIWGTVGNILGGMSFLH